MWDFDVILGMDWLSTHRAPRFLELEFKGDYRVLSMCMISTFEAKRLLKKGCKVYLTHMIETLTLEVTLESVPIMRVLKCVS